jgi:hypothetical protein
VSYNDCAISETDGTGWIVQVVLHATHPGRRSGARCWHDRAGTRWQFRGAGEDRQGHAGRSPWSDEGTRILPSKNYLPFQAEQQKISLEYSKAADAVANDLPQLLREAKQRLNGLFRSSDYPTQADFRNRFGMEVKFSPFPDAEDFRIVELDPEEVKRIRHEIETNIRDTFKEATRDLWTRVRAVKLQA